MSALLAGFPTTVPGVTVEFDVTAGPNAGASGSAVTDGDGEAEFTINGHTSLIQGPAGAPNVMGYSHAVRNPGTRRVEWMNINVSSFKAVYDAFNLGDARVGVLRCEHGEVVKTRACRGGFVRETLE